METLRSLFPTADALLATSPEDLAPVLLRLARARLQPAGFWHDSILNEAGVTGEYYLNQMPLMAYVPPHHLFFNAYISIMFGKRK